MLVASKPCAANSLRAAPATASIVAALRSSCLDIPTLSLLLPTPSLHHPEGEMSENLADLLCFAGVLLFLLGLLTGFAIPALRSPRIGLSAHVASVQSGVALVAFGLVGPRLALPPGWAAAIAHGLWSSLYVLWLG